MYLAMNLKTNTYDMLEENRRFMGLKEDVKKDSPLYKRVEKKCLYQYMCEYAAKYELKF